MGTIYIAHRLFAFHDRMLASGLAQMMQAQHNDWTLFLPYCDTSEDTIIVPKKGYYLFQSDVERLQKLSVLVALLHGPSYDDGVCMEMGMAYATGVPVVILTTDFLTYSFAQDTKRFIFADPLLEIFGAKVIHFSSPDPEIETQPLDIYQHFWQRNASALQNALQITIDTILEQFDQKQKKPLVPQCSKKLLYIEPSSYGQSNFIEAIIRYGEQKEWSCYVARRFRVSCKQVNEAAQQDMQMALKSNILVVDGNGPEVPAGAAFLIGLGLAMKKPRFLYYTGSQITHAHGREENERNLMLLYGCSSFSHTQEDLVRSVMQALDAIS